jgi:hypothetical protein
MLEIVELFAHHLRGRMAILRQCKTYKYFLNVCGSVGASCNQLQSGARRATVQNKSTF